MPPNRAQFHFNQGLTFFQKGEYEKASTYFKECVLEEPQFYEALYNYACCLAIGGDKENALIYLSRAVNLHPECGDWAKEDKEFDSVRSDTLFQRILREDIQATAAVEEEPEESFIESQFEEIHDDLLEAGNTEPETKTKTTAPPRVKESAPNFRDANEKLEDLPPCARCKGILHSERKPRYSPKIFFSVLGLGFLGTFAITYSVWGVVGLPLIAFGLYLFTRVDLIWICNSCDAQGEEAGQPKDAMMTQKAESTSDLKATKK